LAVPIGADPAFSKDIEALTTALQGAGYRKTLGEFARQLAEAEIDLLRIRKLRLSSLEPVYCNPQAKPEDYANLDESLAKLEQYERRAFSRRRRALRAMIAG
jgi:hypothetical protein